MSIPRTWSEELVSEWLCLEGYSTEVGIKVGTGGGGGRKEADVVGVRIIEDGKKGRILQIYHVEVGQLGGEYRKNVAMLKEKFSNERTSKVMERYKKRMAFTGDVQYDKLYIDIWERQTQVEKLMNTPEIYRERIKVWKISDLYHVAFAAIKGEDKYTVSESYWLLKLLESLLEVRRRNKSFELQ
ncbi:MAG: hypothetical protein KAV68_06595 [Dehalococcoidales bacterium]|nr:hypothetical protein [Dehalococcoidales bacterium]